MDAGGASFEQKVGFFRALVRQLRATLPDAGNLTNRLSVYVERGDSLVRTVLDRFSERAFYEEFGDGEGEPKRPCQKCGRGQLGVFDVCQQASDEAHAVRKRGYVCGFRQVRVPFIAPLHVRFYDGYDATGARAFEMGDDDGGLTNEMYTLFFRQLGTHSDLFCLDPV